MNLLFISTLTTTNECAIYVELLNQRDFDMATMFKRDYSNLLKQYYYVGGMPEVVQSFVNNHDFNEVREIQQRILTAYEQDFSKHAPNKTMPRIRMLWNNILAQLATKSIRRSKSVQAVFAGCGSLVLYGWTPAGCVARWEWLVQRV